jgi:hypothetical protein
VELIQMLRQIAAQWHRALRRFGQRSLAIAMLSSVVDMRLQTTYASKARGPKSLQIRIVSINTGRPKLR